MTPDQFRQLEDLFHEALTLPPPERESFIYTRCAGDDELHTALARLLAADSESSPIAAAEAEIGRIVSAALTPGAGEAPGDRIGRYVLHDLIGEGGFGSVYRAEQTEPVRRHVALKVIKLGMDTRQVIARFEAERQALALMTHPGIATVLDAGATPTGRPYFVMELVRGRPITDYADDASLSTERRLELFIHVCDAVQHAHQKGVIHRDLKPSNILVTQEQDSPQPKIIDFGIAKATSARLTEHTLVTEARQFVGTPEYMSPEQTSSQSGDIDTRADIYSLGVVLYELLTGATPFETKLLRGASYPEMQRIIREAPPTRPSSRVTTSTGAVHAADIARARATHPTALRRQLRGDLDWIVLKCLAKERDRRYQTAHDLALDIRRHLANQPVVAGPPSVSYRLQKFARRHRGPIVAGSLILAALVVGLGVATYGFFRARDQRDMALMSLKFLEEIITAPDPNRGQDTGMTILEALDLASQRLEDGSLDGQPEVQFRVRRMLGSTYMAMGLYEKATPHLEACVGLAQEAMGSSSNEAGLAWNDLGEVLRQRGSFKLAADAFERAVDIQRHRPASKATAQTFNNFGLVRQAQGRFEEALSLQQRALEMRLSLFGTEDQEVATSYNNLGALYVSMGQLGQAEDFYRHALEMRERLLPQHHWRVANSQLNLARIVLERGEIDEAEKLATAAMTSTERTLGAQHTQMGRAQLVLGQIRDVQQRWPEAESLYQTSLRTQRQALPAGHPEIAQSLAGLGTLLIETVRYDDAEPILREALTIRTAKLAPDHPLLGVSQGQLGEALLGLGRIDEADDLITRGHAIVTGSRYATPSQRRQAIVRRADLATARGDAPGAARWTAEAAAAPK